MANVIKVKMKKGRSPIRKVRYAAYAAGISMALSPILEPLMLKYLGVVPEGLVRQVIEAAMVNYEVIATMLTAYHTRPAVDDVPEVE